MANRKKPLKKQKIRNSEYYDMQSVFDELYANSVKGQHFTDNPCGKQSVEYNDNRIALYVAQKGKCAVSGVELEANQVDCHHKKPLVLGGDDSYQTYGRLPRGCTAAARTTPKSMRPTRM